MFYRLAFTFGLLVLPLASAEAAYQQKYVLPAANGGASSSSSSSQVMMEKTQEVMDETTDSVVSPWVEVEDTGIVMTRAEFTAELVRSLYTPEQIDHCFGTIAPKLPATFTLIFTDVTIHDDFAKEICVAMRDGIVRGFGDGSFAPERTISFAESAKILSRAFALAPYADADTKTVWYGQHVRGLLVRNAVPLSIKRLNQGVTVGEMREMLDRLAHGITWRPAQVESVIFPATRATALPKRAEAPTETSSTTSVDAMMGPASSSQSSAAASVMHSEESMPVSSKGSFWDLF